MFTAQEMHAVASRTWWEQQIVLQAQARKFEYETRLKTPEALSIASNLEARGFMVTTKPAPLSGYTDLYVSWKLG